MRNGQQRAKQSPAELVTEIDKSGPSPEIALVKQESLCQFSSHAGIGGGEGMAGCDDVGTPNKAKKLPPHNRAQQN